MRCLSRRKRAPSVPSRRGEGERSDDMNRNNSGFIRSGGASVLPEQSFGGESRRWKCEHAVHVFLSIRRAAFPPTLEHTSNTQLLSDSAFDGSSVSPISCPRPPLVDLMVSRAQRTSLTTFSSSWPPLVPLKATNMTRHPNTSSSFLCSAISASRVRPEIIAKVLRKLYDLISRAYSRPQPTRPLHEHTDS